MPGNITLSLKEVDPKRIRVSEPKKHSMKLGRHNYQASQIRHVNNREEEVSFYICIDGTM